MANDNYKIMVLEDKEKNLSAALEALRPYGTIRSTTNYEDAMNLVKGYPLDIAFIDLNFPKVEGGSEEENGYKFRKEILRPNLIPNCIVTQGNGVDHGENIDLVTIESIVYLPFGDYFFQEDKQWFLDGMFGDVKYRRETKTNPKIWDNAYQQLVHAQNAHGSPDLTKTALDLLINTVKPKMLNKTMKNNEGTK